MRSLLGFASSRSGWHSRMRWGAALLAATVASSAPAQSTPDQPVDAPKRPTGPAAPAKGTQGVPADKKRVIQPAGGEWPANYFYDGAGLRFSSMIGKPPPPIRVRNWVGTSVDPRNQLGKVVVVDFWATWCGPCMQAVPHMIELVKRYEKDGLVVVGVHDGQRGWESMQETASRVGINYPIAIDAVEPTPDGGIGIGVSAMAYHLGSWPTVIVIDRAGKVRAAGLVPARLDEVLDKLLKEPAPEGTSGGAAPGGPTATPANPTDPTAPSAPAPAPAAKPAAPLNLDDITTYAEGDATRIAALKELIGKVPTDISSPEWINTKPLTFESLKGKWVLLDFWASWCEPCKDSIPVYNALQAKYKDKLVILGVCQARGAEHMWLVAKEKGIEYPVVRMMSESFFRDFNVDNLPDYYLIDPEGKLRLPDVKNELVEAVLEKLLK